MAEVTVKRIADAQVGDLVWLFDAESPRYVDGKYAGRGNYRAVTIDDRNKASFIVGRVKFDTKTGEERGRRVGYPTVLCGADDREDRRWLNFSHRIADDVRKASAEQLRRVAEIVGFTLEGAQP